MSVYDTLKNMNPRERAVVLGGGALALIILLWAFVVDPVVKGRVDLASRIVTKKQELDEVRQISGKLSQARIRFGAIERGMAEPGGPSLISAVDSISAKSGIKANVVSMEPQPQAEVEGYKESAVALRIEKIPLGGLVDFLKAVGEDKTFMRIKRITIKPLFDNPEALDAAVTLAWYERK